MDSAIFDFRLQHELTTNQLTSAPEFNDLICREALKIKDFYNKCTLSKYLALTKYLHHISLRNSLVMDHLFMDELLKPIHEAINCAYLEIEIIYNYDSNLTKEEAYKTFFFSLLKNLAIGEEMPPYKAVEYHLGEYIRNQVRFDFEFVTLICEYLNEFGDILFYKNKKLIKCCHIDISVVRTNYLNSCYLENNNGFKTDNQHSTKSQPKHSIYQFFTTYNQQINYHNTEIFQPLNINNNYVKYETTNIYNNFTNNDITNISMQNQFLIEMNNHTDILNEITENHFHFNPAVSHEPSEKKIKTPIFNASEEVSIICQLSEVLNLPFIFKENPKIENSDLEALFGYLSGELTNQEFRNTSRIQELDLLSINDENVGSVALICLFKSIKYKKQYKNNAELSRVMAYTFKIDYCEKKRALYLGSQFEDLKKIKLQNILSSAPELYKNIIDFKNNFNSDFPILSNFKDNFTSKLFN